MCDDSSERQHGNVRFGRGIPESHRVIAATLYNEAFGSKFAVAIGNRQQRRQFLAESLRLDFAVAAFDGDSLVGLAGFQIAESSLTSGITYRSLIAYLGFWRGHWAAFVFLLYERKPVSGEVVMDGIAVASSHRGRGIGRQLLNDVVEVARAAEFRSVRLDVIDTNPRARCLYERHGFVEARTESFEYLRWFFGFGSVTTMSRCIPQTPVQGTVEE